MTEETSSLSCKKCSTNSASHMCEDCGTVFCAACLEPRTTEYFLCKDCHHTLGRQIPGEKFQECPECGSESLGVGRKTVEVCAHCHSSRTTLIEDKRRTLAQEMRRAIMSLQYGHTKLREFSNRLVSAKRLLVSLRMANFLHYKWLEDKIEETQTEIPAIKKRIGNQAEIIAKQMVAETKGLIDYISWSPNQFSFIEGVVNRITELGISYRATVEETLVHARLSLEEVKRQLDGLSYYKQEFATFYDYSELSVKELPVCAFPKITLAGSDFLKNDKANGTLFITNKRLVFIAETGRVRKKTDIVFDFPLIYLKSIQEDGRLRKRLILQMKQGNLKVACSDQTKRVLPDYVEIARKFDRYVQTDLQRVRKLEQAAVSVSDVRLRIEGIVYSILSSKSRVTQIPRDRYHQPQRPQHPWPSRDFPGYVHNDENNTPRSFREHLEDTMGRRRTDDYRPPVGQNQVNIESLKRNAQAIDEAAREIILLVRTGRMVPEDFIRRYRGLMRDSYYTRRELERAANPREPQRW